MTVVSSNLETLRGLEDYFGNAGVIVNGTRAIEAVLEMTPQSAAAVILFPDEYRDVEVRSALEALSNGLPEVLIVIVTKDPFRFQEIRLGADRPGPLVIPKPAWVWSILDAVRSRLDSDSALRTARL